MAKGDKSLTAVAQIYPVSLNDTSSIRLYIGGTFVGLNLSFEASLDSTDGTDGNWMPITGIKSTDDVTGLQATGVIGSPQLSSWLFNVSGYSYFRSRVTALTSGAPALSVCKSNGFAGVISVKAVTIAVTQSGAFTMTFPAPTTTIFSSAATTNATSLKGTAGQLFSITLTNYSAAIKYLKLFNKASAPTVGTDIPTLTFAIPANSDRTITFGAIGTRFSTGIAFCLTGAVGDTDTTAVALKDVKGHFDFV